MAKRNVSKEAELFQQIKQNQTPIPNEFTIGMGLQIKRAREEKGLSQSELAQEISRRQAIISGFENGKTDIRVLELVLLSRLFNKPLSFFSPKHILSDHIFEVDNSFEQEYLQGFQYLEHIRGAELAQSLVKVVVDYFEKV